MSLHVNPSNRVTYDEVRFWAFSLALSQDSTAAEKRCQAECKKIEIEITGSYMFIFSTVGCEWWGSASIARHAIRMAITATA
jgi:hypothetical protein